MTETLDVDTLRPRRAHCARCGVPFACGIDDPAGCWCATLPALPRERYDAAAGCLCEHCLRRLLDRDASGETRCE